MAVTLIDFERIEVVRGSAPRPETVNDMERREVRLGPGMAWTEYVCSTSTMTVSITSTSSENGNLKCPEEDADCWALRFGFRGASNELAGKVAFFIVCPTPEMCLYEYDAWVDFHVNPDGVCVVGM